MLSFKLFKSISLATWTLYFQLLLLLKNQFFCSTLYSLLKLSGLQIGKSLYPRLLTFFPFDCLFGICDAFCELLKVL